MQVQTHNSQCKHARGATQQVQMHQAHRAGTQCVQGQLWFVQRPHSHGCRCKKERFGEQTGWQEGCGRPVRSIRRPHPRVGEHTTASQPKGQSRGWCIQKELTTPGPPQWRPQAAQKGDGAELKAHEALTKSVAHAERGRLGAERVRREGHAGRQHAPRSQAWLAGAAEAASAQGTRACANQDGLHGAIKHQVS